MLEKIRPIAFGRGVQGARSVSNAGKRLQGALKEWLQAKCASACPRRFLGRSGQAVPFSAILLAVWAKWSSYGWFERAGVGMSKIHELIRVWTESCQSANCGSGCPYESQCESFDFDEVAQHIFPVAASLRSDEASGRELPLDFGDLDEAAALDLYCALHGVASARNSLDVRIFDAIQIETCRLLRKDKVLLAFDEGDFTYYVHDCANCEDAVGSNALRALLCRGRFWGFVENVVSAYRAEKRETAYASQNADILFARVIAPLRTIRQGEEVHADVDGLLSRIVNGALDVLERGDVERGLLLLKKRVLAFSLILLWAFVPPSIENVRLPLDKDIAARALDVVRKESEGGRIEGDRVAASYRILSWSLAAPVERGIGSGRPIRSTNPFSALLRSWQNAGEPCSRESLIGHLLPVKPDEIDNEPCGFSWASKRLNDKPASRIARFNACHRIGGNERGLDDARRQRVALIVFELFQLEYVPFFRAVSDAESQIVRSPNRLRELVCDPTAFRSFVDSVLEEFSGYFRETRHAVDRLRRRADEAFGNVEEIETSRRSELSEKQCNEQLNSVLERASLFAYFVQIAVYGEGFQDTASARAVSATPLLDRNGPAINRPLGPRLDLLDYFPQENDVLHVVVTSLNGRLLVNGSPAQNGTSATLGRASDNDVLVEKTGVSRRHLVIELSRGAWTVREAGPTRRGTVVDRGGRAIPVGSEDGVVLADGDMLYLGYGKGEAARKAFGKDVADGLLLRVSIA